MKRIIVFAGIVAAGFSLYSQNVDTSLPSVAPKTATTPTPTNTVRGPAPSAEVANMDKEVFVEKLKGVALYGSTNYVTAEQGVPNMTGVRVQGISFLTKKEVWEIVSPYLNKPATRGAIAQMERKIILLCRKNDHPIVDITLPEQNLDPGVIQLVLLEGKVGKVKVEPVGHVWFSTNYTRKNIRLKPGDPIVESKLVNDINWLDQNPEFRYVNVQFQQGGLGGTVDVVAKQEDHFPLQADVGYDNAGVKLVGENRVFGGATWDNAFGLNQKIDYQYMTDTDFKYLRAHSAVWQIPLPWRNTLTFYGSYADMTSDFSAIGITNGPTETGVNDQLSMRYAIPLPRWGSYTHELSLGFDYKYANNNLNFGLFGAAGKINFPTEVEQFAGTYRALMPYSWGSSSFSAEAYYSPGDWSSVNTTRAFNLARVGAKADYYYLKFTAEQMINLPANFSFDVRGSGQYADSDLLPSEEFTLGGVETVRSYFERTANGDEGYLINTELRSPSIRLGSLFDSPVKDSLQLIGFCDYGYTQVHDDVPLVGAEMEYKLCSVGGGLRYKLNKYLEADLYYGYELIRPPALLAQPGYNSSPWMGNIYVIARF